MASQTPPSNKPSPVVPPEGDTPGHDRLQDGGAAGLRLRRVADALRLPLSALYDLPNAVGQASAPGADPGARDGDRDADMDGTCGALLRAYRRIPDPEERRRLLALVQAVADRS